MPTHCDTSLVVKNASGDIKELTALKQFRQDYAGSLFVFHLNSLVPANDASRRKELWGTVEDIAAENIEADIIVAGELYIRFLSKETGIAPWVKEIAPRYPDLYFHLDYFNAVEGFEGELEIQGSTIFTEYEQSIKASA